MKIGIVSSGTQSFALMSILNQYNHEYIIYYDQASTPYGDLTREQSSLKVQQAIATLHKQGVEKIIVPPLHELTMQDDKRILPIFGQYLLQHCCQYSLVGKLGIACDYAESQVAQKLLQDYIATHYQLTPNQTKITKFHNPMKFWIKEMRMWKYRVTQIGWRDPLVNRAVKHDARYFKDADVDTIIPLNWSYFWLDGVMSRFFTYSKQRRHDKKTLQTVLENFVSKGQTDYSIKILVQGHKAFLERDQRLQWILKRGKQVEIVYN